MSQTNETAAPSAEDGAERMAGEFLAEIRRRLGEDTDRPTIERLVPALSRLADHLVIVACDRLARGDMVAFFETALEGMTETERTAWRREVTLAWQAAAQRRWQEREDLRRELLETILFVKALAIG